MPSRPNRQLAYPTRLCYSGPVMSRFLTSRLEGSSPRYQAQHIARWVGLLILIAALALYLWTLDDGLQPEELRGGDLITHQYAQVEARPSNAPGYPLYTMGGWLWFRLGRLLLGPYSNPIRILSSYSTLWALLALWLLYRLLLDSGYYTASSST